MQEINLDFILNLIFESNKLGKDKVSLMEEVRRIIRAGFGHRAKGSLLVEFINQTDFNQLEGNNGIIEAFFAFARTEHKKEAEHLIVSEGPKEDTAKRYILTSLKNEDVNDNGIDLSKILSKMSPLTARHIAM